MFRESPTDSQQSDEANSGKECCNVIVLISELYNFQVISAILVFDVIRGLLNENLTEFNVELLLKIVRSTWLADQFFMVVDCAWKTLDNNFVKTTHLP